MNKPSFKSVMKALSDIDECLDRAIKQLNELELEEARVLTEKSFNKVCDMVDNPPEPTEELKKLMRSGEYLINKS